MKILNVPKFFAYCITKAVIHPRTLIKYYYCSDCKLRFNINENECPKCGRKVGQSPENRDESPIPWWGSILCISIGIITWITSSCLDIVPLGEAARLLVYAPIGHLFGISIKR